MVQIKKSSAEKMNSGFLNMISKLYVLFFLFRSTPTPVIHFVQWCEAWILSCKGLHQPVDGENKKIYEFPIESYPYLGNEWKIKCLFPHYSVKPSVAFHFNRSCFIKPFELHDANKMSPNWHWWIPAKLFSVGPTIFLTMFFYANERSNGLKHTTRNAKAV